MSDVGYEEVLAWFKSGECERSELKAIKTAIDARLGVPEPPYYLTDKETVIEVGGKEIDLITRGRPQMEQLDAFRMWLQQDLSPKLSKLSGEDVEEWQQGTMVLSDGIDLLIELLDVEAIARLGMVLIREEQDFVEEHFDLGWIIDSLTIILNNQPGFVRLTQGFFGARA
jgi:hypothetical protein